MNTNNNENPNQNNEEQPAATTKLRKKYEKRFVEFPLDTEFTAQSLANQLKIPTHAVNNAVKRMGGKIQVVKTVTEGRGRAKRVYKMV